MLRKQSIRRDGGVGLFVFFQAEDGIRDWSVTGVQTCALPICRLPPETYALFEEVRERYGIDVEFEFPERTAVETLVNAEGPNLMYRSVDLRIARSEERRVGKGCRCGWSPDAQKAKHTT